MNKIWVNQLIAGTKTWAEMPISRRKDVKEILAEKLRNGEINAEQYEAITGENAPVNEESADEQ